MSSVRSCAALALLALPLFAAAPAAGQSRDPLPDVRARHAVEAQRVEQMVKNGRDYAYRIVRSDPSNLGAARDKIRTLIAAVEDDKALKPERRSAVLRSLKNDLTTLAAVATDRRPRAEFTLPRQIQADVRRSDDRQRAAAGQRDFKDIQSLFNSRALAVADARKMPVRKAEGFRATQVEVEKSAVPVAEDITFPDDWVEKSKRRSPANKLTAKERSIMEALAKPISVDFENNTLSSVLEWLGKALGQDILTDKRALEEAGVTYETMVTLKLRNVTARTVLRKILADLNLTYVVKDQSIQVTSIARAREMVTTRTYYIGDLTTFANPNLPPVLNQLQMLQNIAMIVNSITTQIDPQSWRNNNPDAVGSITFDPITMTLIIKQTAEVHMALGGGH
ncbi:MAG TPA: hypothetical protein VFE78_27640 [Gemmataceae bacterium]|jgi:hypothetical protein|nr:hypothetical protein [Gemmataceae bacterium]